MDSVVTLLEAFAWPITLLLILFWLDRRFHSEVASFLDRTSEATIDGGNRTLTFKATPPNPREIAADYDEERFLSIGSVVGGAPLPSDSELPIDHATTVLLDFLQKSYWAGIWELRLLASAEMTEAGARDSADETLDPIVWYADWVSAGEPDSSLARDMRFVLAAAGEALGNVDNPTQLVDAIVLTYKLNSFLSRPVDVATQAVVE